MARQREDFSVPAAVLWSAVLEWLLSRVWIARRRKAGASVTESARLLGDELPCSADSCFAGRMENSWPRLSLLRSSTSPKWLASRSCILRKEQFQDPAPRCCESTARDRGRHPHHSGTGVARGVFAMSVPSVHAVVAGRQRASPAIGRVGRSIDRRSKTPQLPLPTRSDTMLLGVVSAPANLRPGASPSLIDRIRYDIQHRLDQLLAEADKLRHALPGAAGSARPARSVTCRRGGTGRPRSGRIEPRTDAARRCSSGPRTVVVVREATGLCTLDGKRYSVP
jgi:hypothetical protein